MYSKKLLANLRILFNTCYNFNFMVDCFACEDWIKMPVGFANKGHYQAVNLVMLLLVPIPAVISAVYIFRSCPTAVSGNCKGAECSALRSLCVMGLQRPVTTAAALYFGVGVLLFWVISLIQQSTWVRLPTHHLPVRHLL